MADVGRPTKYKDEYVEQAYKLCLLGHTDEELATFFDVHISTIYEWKLEYIEFSDAIKRGKDIADMEVAQKLLDRAMGAKTTKQQAIKLKTIDYDNGKKCSETERIEVVELQDEAPPDTTALIFWLKNRKTSAWRDKQVTEHEGGITVETKSLEDIFK